MAGSLKRKYVAIYMPEHPRAHKGHVLEHILVVERALGKPLPEKVVVHHINGDRTDNRNANLVICQDQAYHLLLHKKRRRLQGGFKDRTQCRNGHIYDEENSIFTDKGRKCCVCSRERQKRYSEGLRRRKNVS